jgi:hypothetical protein
MRAYQRDFFTDAGQLHPRRRGVEADQEIDCEIYDIVLGGMGSTNWVMELMEISDGAAASRS